MPIDLVRRFLEAEGGLLEEAAGPGAATAVLPGPLRERLGLPELVLLTEDGGDDAVACGYGSPLLQAATETVLARGPAVAFLEADLPAARPGDPPDVYDGLNVALRPGRPAPSSGWILIGHFLVDAAADDRRRLLVSAAVSLPGGAAVPAPDLRGLPLRTADARPEVEAVARVEPLLRRAALAEALQTLGPFRTAVATRCRRDLLRVDRYFSEMDEELQSRIRRAPRRGGGLAGKRRLLPAERARRLRTIQENGSLRARLSPVAFLFLRSPVTAVPLSVLRRKRRRIVTVLRHPILCRWLPLACEGCGSPVRSFGACDDRLHILCAACLEEGPRRCPRCRRRTGRTPRTSLEVAGKYEEIPVPAFLPGSPLGSAGSEAPPGGPSSEDPAATDWSAADPTPPPGADDVASSPRPDPAGPGARPLVDRLRRALEEAAHPLSSAEIQQRVPARAAELRASLRDLISEGRVRKTGQARGTCYEWLGPEAPKDAAPRPSDRAPTPGEERDKNWLF